METYDGHSHIAADRRQRDRDIRQDIGYDTRAHESRTQGEDLDSAGSVAGAHSVRNAVPARRRHDGDETGHDDTVPYKRGGCRQRLGDVRADRAWVANDSQDHKNRGMSFVGIDNRHANYV